MSMCYQMQVKNLIFLKMCICHGKCIESMCAIDLVANTLHSNPIFYLHEIQLDVYMQHYPGIRCTKFPNNVMDFIYYVHFQVAFLRKVLI